MKTTYLLLGSNLGDLLKNLCDASKLIGERIGRIGKKSGIYKTEPWGFEHANFFLNQVLQVDTRLSITHLMNTLLEIEKQLGRVRTFNNAVYQGRIIDLDILYYETEVIAQVENTVPHPRLHERRFTLEPLAEIAPAFIHPLFKKTNLELLQLCGDNCKVEKLQSQ